MFKVLILICSIDLAPPDCQTNSAIEVINGPEAASETVCGLYGQAFIAETALGEHRRSDEYVKVMCTRSSIGKTVG